MASPIEILVPDIGGFKDVNVIDVLVKDGQQIDKEAPLVTIETEKAAMDVPAPVTGKIVQVKLKTGDKVSEGSLILLLEPAAADAASAEKAPAAPTADAKQAGQAQAADQGAAQTTDQAAPASGAKKPAPSAPPAATPGAPPPAPKPAPGEVRSAVIDEPAFSRAHASPSVRKFARASQAESQLPI